jgi:hypothetical protein
LAGRKAPIRRGLMAKCATVAGRAAANRIGMESGRLSVLGIWLQQ